MLFIFTGKPLASVIKPIKIALMGVSQQELGQKGIQWWPHQWAWSKFTMLFCSYHAILYAYFHQKWMRYGICIENLSKMKPQCIRYSVLQTKVKAWVR